MRLVKYFFQNFPDIFQTFQKFLELRIVEILRSFHINSQNILQNFRKFLIDKSRSFPEFSDISQDFSSFSKNRISRRFWKFPQNLTKLSLKVSKFPPQPRTFSKIRTFSESFWESVLNFHIFFKFLKILKILKKM